MWNRVWPSVVACLLIFPVYGAPQQIGNAQVQPGAILSQAEAALTGSVAVKDITLAGSAERIAGGDDDTGSVSYKAVLGSSRLDLSFGSGVSTEVRSTTANGVAGSWIGPDGVSHAMIGHNLMTDVGWFPLFTVGDILSSKKSVLTYVGTETHNGSTTIHVMVFQQATTASGDPAILPQHLSQVDLYLSPTTFLPVAVAFNIHPDNDALIDIPIEVRFSDYRTIGGVTVPFHVQKFLNNGLYLDLQFQNAVINSGLNANSVTN